MKYLLIVIGVLLTSYVKADTYCLDRCLSNYWSCASGCNKSTDPLCASSCMNSYMACTQSCHREPDVFVGTWMSSGGIWKGGADHLLEYFRARNFR